jgi:zona occludens toxin
MAVYLYEGLPGSGKSFHILKDTIIPALRLGRRVFHNLPIRYDILECNEFSIGYLRRKLIKVNSEFLLNLPKYKKLLEKSLLVIDEAHETFFSGDKIADADLRNFWTYHRHGLIDVVVATQVKTNIAKIIQAVIAVRFEFRNLGVLGLKGIYEIKQYEGFNGKTALGSKRGRFVKKYFDYYLSADIGHENIFKFKAPVSFNLLISVAGLLLLAGVGVWAFSSLSVFNEKPKENIRVLEQKRIQEMAVISSEKELLNPVDPTKYSSWKDFQKNDSVTKTEIKANRAKVSLGGVGEDYLADDLENSSIEALEIREQEASALTGPLVHVANEEFGGRIETGLYVVTGLISVGSNNIYFLKRKFQKFKVRSTKLFSLNERLRVY